MSCIVHALTELSKRQARNFHAHSSTGNFSVHSANKQVPYIVHPIQPSLRSLDYCTHHVQSQEMVLIVLFLLTRG